jgi:large subunit ribosomal protein L23
MANPNLYYRLIRRPVVTEKSSTLQSLNNQVTFEVIPEANKSEVKKAVETLRKGDTIEIN